MGYEKTLKERLKKNKGRSLDQLSHNGSINVQAFLRPVPADSLGSFQARGAQRQIQHSGVLLNILAAHHVSPLGRFKIVRRRLDFLFCLNSAVLQKFFHLFLNL